MYAQKSFICYERYIKCKLLFLYFLLFSSKFCTNMYACFNNTSRKFGGNMWSSFKFIIKRVKLDAIFWNSLRQSGPKSLDRLSLFSFIHPFTALALIFGLFSSGIVTPNPCIQMQFPLPTPCFNVALNSGVRASTIWINIENGERRKSLVITPQWSNTFDPDCLSKM